MSPRTASTGAGAAAIAAAAGAAGAVGAIALERAARRRRELRALDPTAGYDHPADEVLTVSASDGVALHVEVNVPPGGAQPGRPTIILAHGFTLSLDSWVFQRRALTEAGYRVVAWDQRGHGQSGRSDDEHATITQLGEDLAAVIAAAAPTGDLVLVGHSMGGMTVMALAHYHPDVVRERVLAVGLLATSAGGTGLTNLDFGPAIGHMLGRVGPGVLQRLDPHSVVLHRIRFLGRTIEDALVARYSFDSPVSHNLVRFCGDMIFGTSFATMSQFLNAIEELDESEALEVLHGIETLVMNGRGDLLTPPEHSDDLVRRIPGAEHVLVENCGHLIMLEHPELVCEQLLLLIQRGLRARAAHPQGTALSGRPGVRRTLTDLARQRRVRRARAAAAS